MINSSDEKWQRKLIELKADTGFTFQQLASRLKCQTSNLIRIYHGTLKMPLATRARLLDLSAFRSTREICLALLDADTSASINQRHDAYIQKNLDRKLKRLSEHSLDALEMDNEFPAWIEILDELKTKHDSDQRVADVIGTTRAAIGFARRSERRLPTEAKLNALSKTAFIVNDNLLLTLMSAPTIEAIREMLAND